MVNDFDRVASFYDVLARWMFGKEWLKLQLAPADLLPKHTSVLIVGGGTGQLLESLPSHLNITYVEMSAAMIEKARAREISASIDFVQYDYLKWDSAQSFDAILFPFFLDLFTESRLKQVIEKASVQLQSTGELHVIDFVRGKWHQRLLMKLMHCFFSVFADLESRKLKNWHETIIAAGFGLKSDMPFMNEWVRYKVYSKAAARKH